MELNEKTYETYLLSYIDNELSHSERLMVERFVKSEPKYTAALKDLQNAILQPETIVFEDKALLYRLEEMNASLDLDFKKSLYRTETATPTTPVISLWNRNVLRYSAIAALFVLTIGTAIMSTSNKDKAIVLSANNSIPEAKKLIGNINDGIVSPTQALNSNQPSQVLAANTKSSVQLVGKSKTEPFQPISIGVEHTIIASSSNTLKMLSSKSAT